MNRPPLHPSRRRLGPCRTLTIAAALLVLPGCGDDAELPECEDGQATETCEVFRLVNLERDDAGLPPYAWSPQLGLAAQRHAQDMVDNGYFDHMSQDGRSFSDRSEQAGYEGFPRGENIAAGQQGPQQVMDAWMDSPGHRSNILSDADEIGVGLVDAHWVQVFGQAE
ncbi:MAG: CAP domain-containing protein [Nannocystaceae bacterium]